MPASSIDIIIPTLNASQYIEDAVINASHLGQVYVVDSFSSDDTVALAEKCGAVAVQHTFESYAKQKNWALNELPLHGEWVFILDADERITRNLCDEITRITSDPSNEVNGYYVNRLLIFMGKAVRHGGLFPSWNLRLFRRGKAHYEERVVHEHMVCELPTAYLKNWLLHIRDESIHRFVEKHIKYADLESDEWIKQIQQAREGEKVGKLFSDNLKWRQWLRRKVWPRLPARPLLRFVYMYFLRLGFLDGRAGWHMASLMASYELMISMLYREKRN